MRVAVISDVHGNLHALDAVLAAIDREGPDQLWCLGDLVGYGAEPSACCDRVAARASTCLAGNHDLGVLGTLSLADFADEAAISARWTRGVLTERARAYLEPLAPRGAAEGVELFHGSPRDPVWEYVLSADAAEAALQQTTARVVLVGHSHVALAVAAEADGIVGGVARGGSRIELADSRWLLNPGSVGQPRDGDPRAAFLMLDLDARTAQFERVEYPIALAQAEIRACGLPVVLAERLAHGT